MLAEPLVKVNSRVRSKSVCCSGEFLSCNQASVDTSVLGSSDLELPGGITAQFQGNVLGNKNAYVYKGQNVEVVLTQNPSNGGLHGHAMAGARSYVLEYCGSAGHVWKEIDVQSMGEHETVDFIETEEISVADRSEHLNRIEEASRDTTTMVTYSVKFYYTPEFAAATADIEGFLDQVIAETNQGYNNSGVPLQVVKACSELATINDQSSASDVLSAFADMKSSKDELRDTADAAALLVNSFGSCGIGYLNTIGSKYTFTATRKSCATGYYSFGHEVGHNFGLHHDPASSTNTAYPYGHGHLIAQGSDSRGHRTILAYSATNHNTRVNYYSNPNIIYPSTGTPTGEAVNSDNARVLMENRMAMAAVGDESSPTCRAGGGGGTTGTTSAPGTTAAPPTGGTCTTTTGEACVFPFVYRNRFFKTCTSSDGDQPWCATADGWGYCSPGCPGCK